MSERLPRSARIRRTGDIRRVLREGRRIRTRSLELIVLRRADLSRVRVGWIVPKLGHRIVQRNQLKRRLREIARKRVLSPLLGSERRCDVLMRAGRKAYLASYAALEAEVEEALDLP